MATMSSDGLLQKIDTIQKEKYPVIPQGASNN